MTNKSQFSNAFSRVLSKSKVDEVEEKQQLTSESTSKLVNQNDEENKETELYEVSKNDAVVSEKEDKQVKKLTSKSKEIRTVKGFKLTAKTQKIIGMMAQMQGKKEYEIIEQGVELLLEQNPEINKFLKVI